MTPALRPFPPGEGRALLRRLALVCAVGALIAVVVWGLRAAGADGRMPYDVPLVYSLGISVATWAAIDPMRFLLRGPLRAAPPDYWPPPRATAGLLLVAIPLGYGLGMAIGDAYAGRPALTFLDEDHALLVGLLVLSAVASLALVVHFHQHGRAESLARQAREAELALLQSQLEPHMLFNTLANLRVLIATDPPRAQAMLDRLIAFLRATLSASRRPTHPLDEEFARIGDYLALMALRMGPRLAVRLDLPDALRALPVPPFLLQPLVENAIRHGLEPKPGGGRIEIAARREGGRLLLTVRDTGLGLRTPSADGTRFGIAQVRGRLRTLYGASAALSLADATDPDGGAVATLDIPASP